MRNLEVVDEIHVVEDAHLGCLGCGASLILVVEGLGDGECHILVEGEIGGVGKPVAVDGLVVDYECKRLGGIVDAVEPMEALVGYHVGDISFFGHGVAALLDEAGIPVVALSGHNLPVVESLGH